MAGAEIHLPVQGGKVGDIDPPLGRGNRPWRRAVSRGQGHGEGLRTGSDHGASRGRRFDLLTAEQGQGDGAGDSQDEKPRGRDEYITVLKIRTIKDIRPTHPDPILYLQ